jgi:hypothetical protein
LNRIVQHAYAGTALYRRGFIAASKLRLEVRFGFRREAGMNEFDQCSIGVPQSKRDAHSRYGSSDRQDHTLPACPPMPAVRNDPSDDLRVLFPHHAEAPGAPQMPGDPGSDRCSA